MLKKEFKRKDVNRARNLIMGNSGDSTGTQIGYNKKNEDYKEGDVWTEGKKTWTIKNGIKQTVSKLDAIKKEIFMPLCCPRCNKVMKGQLDKPNYKIHKKCHNCVIEHEHKLLVKDRSLKLYNDYKNNLKTKNNLEYLKEIESYLLDVANSSNSGYVSEDGVVERWVGGVDKKKMTKEITQATKQARKKIND
jgi:transcription elongation factor Elf1